MAKLIRIHPDNPQPRLIQEVARALDKGALVIYPTDTVYTLGCSIMNKKAIEKVARIKGVKPEKANFSFVCPDLSNLSTYAKQVNNQSFKVMKRCLPGPYTFIVEASSTLPRWMKHRSEIGIRVPEHNVPHALTEELGHPIISTSIRDEDMVIEYTTDPSLIFDRFKHEVDYIIDSGYGDNVASTVVDLTDDMNIVREGKGELDLIY